MLSVQLEGWSLRMVLRRLHGLSPLLLTCAGGQALPACAPSEGACIDTRCENVWKACGKSPCKIWPLTLRLLTLHGTLRDWCALRESQLRSLNATMLDLVDPASSHMLVSKIKPCMSKYKLFYTVKLRMAH